MRLVLSAAITLVALAVPSLAHADTLDSFSVTGHGLSLTFELPSNPTPDGHTPHNDFFIGDVSFVENGVTMIASDAYFYTKGAGGGFDLEDVNGNIIDNLDFLGPKLFTGPVRNPTFKTGDFTLRQDECSAVAEDASADASCLQKYDLTISGGGPIAATPEPGSLVLLGTGGLAALGTLRRRFKA